MVLDKLSTSLKESLKKLAKSIFLDERAINEFVKEIQKALLKADVNVQLVFDLTSKIKERALKEVKEGNREKIIKIVYEELVEFLGREKSEIKIEKKPFKIMFVGIYGSGKSTTIGKLARYYSKRGYKVATLGLDVHRPAAFEQLRQVSEEAKVKSFIFKDKDPVKIYKKFEKELNEFDIVLIDTAGRDALSKELIEEISLLNKEIKPDEKILVMGADIGQAAKNLAEGFHKSSGVTGIIITKLDGTAKGGGALTGASVTGAKIKFIGLGEKLEDIEVFNPAGFVSRMLGMGDIEALLEKFDTEVSKEQAEDLGKKLLKGEFNFVDLYEQMQTMKKLGPLNKIVEMVPGFGSLNIPKEMFDVQEGKIDKWKDMMASMTKKELEDPDIITTDRIARISSGSGTTTAEVKDLLKQYKQSKKMMKMLKGKDPSKLMKKFRNLKLK
nr:signal recognition particle protein [Candidatus Woesearchaeota archaeon]